MTQTLYFITQNGRIGLLLMVLLLSGCAARKPYAGPQWHGPWPKGIDCGVPTKFDGGSQWVFPCWPEKNEPRCVSGCDNASEATPDHGDDGFTLF